MHRACTALFLLSAASISAQTSFLKPFTVDSLTYRPQSNRFDYHMRRDKPLIPNFKLESFGYSRAPVSDGDEFAVKPLVNFYNPMRLECPVCAVAPPNRTRFSQEPFGAKATYRLFRNHLELFASTGGEEAWKTDGMLQNIGHQKLPNFGMNPAIRVPFPDLAPAFGGASHITNDQFNDAWLVQSHLGARVYVDPRRNISFGFTKGYMYNFSPFGPPSWTSTTGDLTITFGSGPAKFLAKRLLKIREQIFPIFNSKR
jgi:hypothetical protein